MCSVMWETREQADRPLGDTCGQVAHRKDVECRTDREDSALVVTITARCSRHCGDADGCPRYHNPRSGGPRHPEGTPPPSPPSLSDRAAAVARLELGESPERVARGLETVRRLAAENELYPNEILYDEFLLRFLRARKFKADAAYAMLERYRDVIGRFPLARRPSELLAVFAEELSAVLVERDATGRRVFVCRAGRWDPSSCSLWDLFHANLACLELLVREPDTQVCGLVALVDMAGLGLRQARHLTPAYAREVISLIQDCFPLRFKEIHFVNEPYIFYLVYSVLKPFLSEKLVKRMHFHGKDLASLRRHLQCTALPAEYGGAGGSFSSSSTLAALRDLEERGWC